MHGDASLAALHENYECDHSDHHDDEQNHQHRRQRSPRCIPGFVNQVGDAARQTDNDIGEDQQRHSVANATFRDLLAQPHNEHASSRQREDRHQDKARARTRDKGAGLLQTYCDKHRLQRAEQQCQIAGVHRDLLAAKLALFLKPCQGLIEHGQQLQNDRRSDVRHDAEGEDGHPAKLSAGKQVHKAQQRTAILFNELLKES